MYLSRIASFLLAFLSATLFVCASPIAEANNMDLVKRNGENDDAVLSILTNLKAKVDIVVPEIDAISPDGDPTALLAEISAAVDVAVSALVVLSPDESHDWTDPKKVEIANLFVKIILEIVVVLGKFTITTAFLSITATVDLFIHKLLVAIDGAIVGIVVFAAPLVTDIDIFVKLKLFLTLTDFGIPH